MLLKNMLFALLLLCTCLKSFTQSRFLTGTVRMEGRPVSGVVVYTSFASIPTDNLGRYALPLDGCPSCRPGHQLIIYTTHSIYGSSEQSYTINNDYKFNFNIIRGTMMINGQVQTTGLNPGSLAGIEVKIMSGDIDTDPVVTNSFGEFKIPVSRALLENNNAIRLQMRDPDRRYKPLRTEPELYSINSFIILRMEPNDAIGVDVEGYKRSSVCVRNGDVVTMEAEGHIRVGAMVGTSDPDGRNTGVFGLSLESYNIVSTINHAALMYRLQGEREWRLAGKRRRFKASKDGCIEFQVNDNIQDDNVGSYTVNITVQRG
jgi:hypothetical protein